MMRRRRYIQATALALAGGLAGCSELGTSGDESPRNETATQMETATATETEEPTPAEEPPNVEAPLWLELIPRTYMTEGKYSEVATFSRLDWEWYVANRAMDPEWGPTADESWTPAPWEVNVDRVPSADILKTPQWGSYITSFNAEAGVFEPFKNIGPEMERQCGWTGNQDGYSEEARTVEEVLTFNNPNMTVFIGVDTAAVHDALANNDTKEYDGIAVTSYSGADEGASRNIFVSEEWPRGVVGVETGDEKTEALGPVLERFGREEESVAQEASVQWAYSRLGQPAPVVTGEMNGSQYVFTGNGRSDRSVERLEPFDTFLTGLKATQFTGTVQHIFARTDGNAPEPAALEESFKLESGKWSTEYHPSVSKIDATWPKQE